MPGNSKTYNITINGVTQAVKSVEELQQVVQEVAENVEDLNNSEINIDVNTDTLDEANQALEQTNEAANQLGNTLTSTFTIDVDGVATDFENITQAIGFLDDRAQGLSATLQQMRELGEDNTEEYQKLTKQFEEYINQSARLERARQYSDAVRDSLASQTRSLDLAVQGFTALGNAMQIASGIAGLFGQNQEEIEESINRTVQIMAILQAAQELYNQAVTQGTILNRTWSVAMQGAASVMSALGIATNSTSIAMRGLQAAIAGTGIGLLVVGVGELVNWLMRLAQSSKDSADNVNTLFDVLERRIDNFNRSLDTQVELGLISEFEKLTIQIDNANNAIQRLKVSVNSLGETSTLSEAMQGVRNYNYEQISSGDYLDERQIDHYSELLLKLYDSSNYANMSLEELYGLLYDVGQGLTEFNPENLNFDDLSEEENDALRNFYENSVKYLEEIYSNRIELSRLNFESEEEYNNLRFENTKKTLNDELELIKKHYDELRKQYELDYNTKVMLQQQAEQGNNEAATTLAVNERMIQTINDAEQRAMDKARQENLKKEQDYQNQITNIKINALNDGYQKELAQLTQSYLEKRQEALRQENVTQELLTALEEQYQANIQRLNEEYYERRLETLKQFRNESAQIYQEIFQAETEYARNKVNMEAEQSINQLTYFTESFNMNDLEFGDLDISKYFNSEELTNTLNSNLNSINQYYESIFNIANEQANRISEINKEALTFNYDTSVQNENERYEEQVKSLKDALDEQIISEEDYNTESERLKSVHDAKLLQLQRDYNKQMEQLNLDLTNKLQEITASRQENEIKGLREQFNELNKLYRDASQNINIGDNNLNQIGNIATNLINKEKFQDTFKEISNEIETEMKDLTNKFKNGEISFGDFQKMKAELDSLQQANQEALEKMEMDWQDWSQTVATLGNAMIGMWANIYSSIANMQYQNEMNRIEEERELLDEELEMLDEQYQAQQELYEQHTDRIQSIEDELQTARGERRTFLIDQISQEQAAQEAAWNAEQRIQRQREQAERKQEQLEKQQEQAERKRNNAQKKVQILQATANTAVAVTNALAVQPWFVGVALAAVAAAMGAAQIAIISKTQYKDGGLLTGKPHSQGGIPIPNTNIEVEGNEYVINKETTMSNLPLITYINSKRRKLNREDLNEFFDKNIKMKSYSTPKVKYQDGGQLQMQAPNSGLRNQMNQVMYDDRPIYVSVTEIERVANNLRNVRVLSGLEE